MSRVGVQDEGDGVAEEELGADGPVEPTSVGRVSHDRIDAFSYQHMSLLPLHLDLMVE